MPLGDPWFIAFAVLALIVVVLGVQLHAYRGRLSDLREAAREVQDLRTALAQAQVQSERVPGLEAEIGELKAKHEAEIRARTAAEAQLQTLRAEHEARLEELRNVKQELEDRFASLASGVLEKNSEAFLKLASERLKSHEQTAREELEKRKQAIETLVKPLGEKLTTFDKQIREIEQARNEAYGTIREQVRQLAENHALLGNETRKLVQALRAPKTRGRWGEMQLRQVFELAGMTEHVDYMLEHHTQTDGGALRPDAIVRIPGGKSIVVDAKTPLEAYLDALEAETPEDQQVHLARHARQVRDHVQLLSSKRYQEAFDEAPDFVVMFIPGETFVGAAAEADPGLLEDAFRKKVLIATPTTLMALVKAIAYGWQQEKMAENAVEVQRIARELYDRLKTFGGHVDKLGNALRRSVDAYNSAVGSMEARVLPSARKFETMGVVPPGSELPAPDAVEIEPRRLAHPDDEA